MTHKETFSKFLNIKAITDGTPLKIETTWNGKYRYVYVYYSKKERHGITFYGTEYDDIYAAMKQFLNSYGDILQNLVLWNKV